LHLYVTGLLRDDVSFKRFMLSGNSGHCGHVPLAGARTFDLEQDPGIFSGFPG
jgi:hypothetical protein